MPDNINQAKIVFKIEITAYDDGQLAVAGPIDQPAIFFDLMNQAERSVLNRMAKKAQEAANQRIIKPELGLKVVGH